MDGKQPRGNRAPSREESASIDAIGVDQVQRLVRLLDGSDVAELELRSSNGGVRLALRKIKAAAGSEQPVAVAPAPAEDTAPPAVETRHTIVASWVGTFHTWAKPKGSALVNVGDRVKVGQLVATIESLNVLNEVEATVAGRVAEILVQEGQPVEYGQPLLVIDSVEEA